MASSSGTYPFGRPKSRQMPTFGSGTIDHTAGVMQSLHINRWRETRNPLQPSTSKGASSSSNLQTFAEAAEEAFLPMETGNKEDLVVPIPFQNQHAALEEDYPHMISPEFTPLKPISASEMPKLCYNKQGEDMEIRQEMIWEVSKLRQRNFERTGVYDHPPPDMDIAKLVAIQKEKEAEAKKKARFPPRKGMKKKLKTRAERDRLSTAETVEDDSETDDEPEVLPWRLYPHKKRVSELTEERNWKPGTDLPDEGGEDTA